jgi:hypothetical protein
VTTATPLWLFFVVAWPSTNVEALPKQAAATLA